MKLLTNVKIENVTEKYDPELLKLADAQGVRCPFTEVTVTTNKIEFVSTDTMILDDFEDGSLAESYTLLLSADDKVEGVTPSDSRFEEDWKQVYNL